MKGLVLLALFICLTCFARAQKPSQVTQNSGRDLVVELPGANTLQLVPELKKKFADIEGVRFTGLCESKKYIFLQVTEDAFFSSIIALKELELNYTLHQDISIAQAQQSCEKLSNLEASTIETHLP